MLLLTSPWRLTMHMWNQIAAAIQFLSEGAGYAFRLRKDEDYPAIGVQPFDGEPFSRWIDLNQRW